MAYNKKLAERMRRLLFPRKDVSEKAMFGGLSFLVDRKMFCGVIKDDLVVRVDPAKSEAFLQKHHPVDGLHRKTADRVSICKC